MRQPIIGITMASDDYDLIRQGVDFSFIRKEYGEQVHAAGGQPIFLDSSIDPEAAAKICDGIVISGGEDINPVIYGGPQLVDYQMEPIQRSVWERKLINACDKKGIRILGVCYGSQLLNIHYGGTLYQDINTQFDQPEFHGSSTKQTKHRVKFSQDFLSFQKNDSVETAHRHHQAVKDLAPGFTAVAKAADGVIEAIAGHGHFGVQWHAESDGTASSIYGSFIELCSRQGREKLGSLSTAPQLS